MKTKLTPELVAQAAKMIAEGCYVETVAQALGIHKSTWYEWIKKGEEEEAGIYRDFADAIKKATPQAEIKAVEGVLKAGREGNWQALAWFLERRFPERYGRRDRVSLEQSGEVKVIFQGLPRPERGVSDE